MLPIRYTLRPARPEAHLFEVRCTVAEPHPDGQRFFLPTWIPGSYMIREFARHIVSLRAETQGRDVAIQKRDKHTWQAAAVPKGEALTLIYEVYAWDLSVRAAHLDTTHGFFNGTSVFLAVEGQLDVPCQVDIQPPECGRHWQVATTLPRAEGEPDAAPLWGFGLYRAADYFELIDHPVEMGTFALAHFEAGGIPHSIVLSGRQDCNFGRLKTDLARICQWQADLFGGLPPMARYLFLVQAVDEGYGGLEHRASCALIARRDTLPFAGMKKISEGYKTFLGLCSHEYFHLWNVKRIKPAAFEPYNLAHENHTRLLWAFEGITSYYDDIALIRSKTISVSDYLALLEKTISAVLKTPGRKRQSVAQSSFDAWTHFYRQDENSPNAIVSYYAKGALITLALDLRIRFESGGSRSLDDVMRTLWRRYGLTGVGVPEEGIYSVVGEMGGNALAHWLLNVVEGTDDLPLEELFKPFGVRLRVKAASASPSLGIELKKGRAAAIATVYDGSPAQLAGLSAGDVLIAVNGLRADASRLPRMLERLRVGKRVEIYAFRRDELMRFELELAPAPLNAAKLSLENHHNALQNAWLGQTSQTDA
ncbi:MAG: PDZ domain-containing protein [Azoarcus sp.]|jgi:predicted metalloprotease with PDZ domain|nr:PDZ domain-containing protein [Azoarcus sp.]